MYLDIRFHFSVTLIDREKSFDDFWELQICYINNKCILLHMVFMILNLQKSTPNQMIDVKCFYKYRNIYSGIYYGIIDKELTSMKLRWYPWWLRSKSFLSILITDSDKIDYICIHIKRLGTEIIIPLPSRHITQSLAYLN